MMKTASLMTIFSVASAHNSWPVGSGFPSEETCRSMTSETPILSHHIHLFQNQGSRFTGDEVEQPEDLAEDINRRMAAALNITETCQSWVGYDSVRCGFNMDGGPGERGWELVPALPDRNWAFSILPSDFAAAVQWIQKNRCVEYTPEPSDDPKYTAPKHDPLCYDIFIHPNTGCFINDHHEWGMWIGTPHTVLDLGFAPCLYGCGPSSQPGCNPGIGLGDERMMCLMDNEEQCMSKAGDGLGLCLVQNDCLSFEDGNLDVAALTSCLQRIPIVNPNPACGDKLDILGALDCVGNCDGEDGCILECVRGTVDIAPGLQELLSCTMGDGVCSDTRGFGALPCNEDGSVAGIDLCCDGYSPLGELFPDTKPAFPDQGCEINGNLLCGVDFVSQPDTWNGEMRRDTWANIMEAARTKPNTIDVVEW